VALVDMNVWRWLYQNKNAGPAELRQAVLQIAKGIWDKYYAPLFGVKGSTLLAIYSHMINYGLYLPDYPLGHIIAFQVEEYFKEHDLAVEMERMCVQGSITPKEWMRLAVGADISPQPLIRAAARALSELKDRGQK
jgi:oligoendopeptidase F